MVQIQIESCVIAANDRRWAWMPNRHCPRYQATACVCRGWWWAWLANHPVYFPHTLHSHWTGIWGTSLAD